MRRLVERWRARRRLRNGTTVWFHPGYAAPQLAKSARVTKLQPRRGEMVLTRLVQDKLLRANDVSVPLTASLAELRRFHTDPYLAGVAHAERLAPIFGLVPEEVDVDQLLHSARWAVGGTVGAARKVARRRTCAVNLGGGFHHAEPDQGSGFCVYNDVGVAIRALRDDGVYDRVAIVDLDFHQGNGNSAAFEHDPSVMVFSIHGAVWRHIEGNTHEHHLTKTVDDRRYLSFLEETLPAALRAFQPRVIFYIAGMDVLASDELGSFSLSLDGVFERDRLVVDLARDLRAGLVVTMAGGYSSEAWTGTYNLARYVLSGRPRVWRPRVPDLRARFERIARQLDPNELTQEEDLGLTEADVFGDLVQKRGSRRLLDYYTQHGVETALERYGLLGAVRERGFQQIEIEIAPDDPSRQVVRVRGRKHGVSEQMLLVELVVRRTDFAAPWDEEQRTEMLEVMWLLLQDPSRSFTLARPQMPGQEHPGLGIGKAMGAVLVQAALRLGLAGLLNRPSHFHNARVSSGQFFFVDPEVEGHFQALAKALRAKSLADASKAVETGLVLDANGAPYAWEPADHVLPVSDAFKAYFESPDYRSRRDQAERDVAFTVID